MFKINLKMARFTFSGLEALEKRRLLKLEDGTSLQGSGQVHSGNHEPSCEVNESFARTWFHSTQTYSEATVPFDLLTPTDVKLTPNGYVATFADIPPERIQELYAAARIRGLISENERLEKKIEELQNEPADDES